MSKPLVKNLSKDEYIYLMGVLGDKVEEYTLKVASDNFTIWLDDNKKYLKMYIRIRKKFIAARERGDI